MEKMAAFESSPAGLGGKPETLPQLLPGSGGLPSSSGELPSSGGGLPSGGSSGAALVPRAKRHAVCVLLDSSLDNFSLTNILEFLTVKDISLVLSLVKSTSNVPTIFVPSEKLLREVLKKCLIKGIMVRGDLRKTLEEARNDAIRFVRELTGNKPLRAAPLNRGRNEWLSNYWT